MKQVFVLLLVCSFSVLGFAQANDSNNFSNFTDAKKYAAEQNKTILMVFSGSDWCRPCIQFKKEILEHQDFIKYAKGELAILYLDFPSKRKNKLSKEQTKHNEALAEKYNLTGSFPKILLIDMNETIIGEIPFKNQKPSSFIHSSQKILHSK